MVTLESGHTAVSIDRGELVSLKSEGHEYIHQKGSQGWSSSDTEMFPIIGPVNENNFAVQVPRGNAIQDQHGHLRQFEYELKSSTKTTAIFGKTYKAGTPIKNSKYPEKSTKQWLLWPYSFEFEKSFDLTDSVLEITFTVNGEKDMPFMLGYHPAFRLCSDSPQIIAQDRMISLDEVLAVGSRALQIENSNEVVLRDHKELLIRTEGFGHFMCWTEVRNMVCIEPITFYPYAVKQQKLHEGFEYLDEKPRIFKVWISI